MSEAPADDPLSLAGRLALVTGGGGGIGGAVVELLLRAGAEVVSVDLPGRDEREDVRTIACDLGEPAGLRMLGEEVGRLRRLDAVVHCAGITRDAVLWKLDPRDWDRVMRVNLDSAFHLLRFAVPVLRASGGGSVVLVASINGERGKFGQANYAASKAGLIALGKTAARELGRFGIRVNSVSPGLILTSMTENLPADVLRQAVDESALGRPGRPEDVARAVLYLCSPLSAHVTGQVLRVDGGQCTA